MLSLLSFRRLVSVFTLGFGTVVAAFAANFNVASDSDLRSALNPTTGAQSGDTVTFTGSITLGADLPAVQNSITIEGNGYALDGNSQFRGFFVGAFAAGTATQVAVTVTIRDLTIQHALAKGGDAGYGGGGAGFGGAIFVANLANLALSNVVLSTNSAVGGSAGRDNNIPGSFIAGGGGMGGEGYSGGGGIGVGSDGANNGISSGLPNAFNALPGIFTGSAPGGDGSLTNGLGLGAPGPGGGGGGAGGGGGGGGVGGSAGTLNGYGGNGGFGGGGGSAGTIFADAGNGGFGGGGGGAWEEPGGGGFGGGGGGVNGGVSSFGGGGGGSVTEGLNISAMYARGVCGGGGGGAGMGGAIFVQQGGRLSISGPLTLNGNAVTGGAGGVTNPGSNPPPYAIISNGFAGKAFGNGVFLQGNDGANGGSGVLSLSPAAGQTQTISDTISDQSGSGGFANDSNSWGWPVNTSGNWGLTINGAGTVVFTGPNKYSGGTALNSGTLQVNNTSGSGTGSGAVTVAAWATLGGTGTVAGSVVVQGEGRLTPGNGIGTLSVGGGVTWNGSSAGASTAFFTLGTGDATSSKLAITGALTRGSGTLYRFDFQGTGRIGTTYTLATFASTTFVPTDFSAVNLAPGLSGSFILSNTSLQYAVLGQTTFSQNPASVTVSSGRSAVFTIATAGLSATTFQWNFNGAPIPGASDAILLVSGATSANAGSYTCTATNSFGSVTSTPATLTVATAGSSPGFLVNISARGYVGTGLNAEVGGFGVTGSGSKAVLVRGIGPGLDFAFHPFPNFVPNPTLTLFNGAQAQINQNAGWGDSSTLMAAFSTLGAFSLSPSSSDSALLTTLTAPASYTAQITSGVGGDGTGLVELYDADSGAPSVRLINISARALVQTGQNILIGGFGISGSTAETVLIRAVGPGMFDTFGISTALPQPVLTLYSGSTPIFSNTGWGGDATIAGTFGTTGAFPLNPAHQDSVLLLTLPPGSYTAQVTGLNGGTGIALIEIYEVY